MWGRRAGKTTAALLWLIREIDARADDVPHPIGYYVAPYRDQAKAIAWEEAKRITRHIRRAVNESELTITLANGGMLRLRGADDPESLEGVGLVACVLDEFARMKPLAWDASLRPALSDHRGRALFCGKPRGYNHLHEHYQRGVEGPGHVDGWWSSHSTTAAGGFVDAADIAQAKRDLPGRIFRQEYEASWEHLAGRVYDEWSPQRGGQPWHVVPHADLEREFKRGGRWVFREVRCGVDWGLTSPGAMVIAGITGTGRVVVLEERYERDTLVSELGWLRIARELRDRYGVSRFHADPSEPGNVLALQRSVAPSAVAEGAENAVAEGIRRISIKLLAREDGRPGLVVSDRCTNLIRETAGYVWREVRGVTVEEPADVDDHALDALRYCVMGLTRFERERVR